MVRVRRERWEEGDGNPSVLDDQDIVFWSSKVIDFTGKFNVCNFCLNFSDLLYFSLESILN